jgi:hypothetical protein
MNIYEFLLDEDSLKVWDTIPAEFSQL